MDLFWPSDSLNHPLSDDYLRNLVTKHGFNRDPCAFCYTVSILLLLASDEDIAERKEEIKEIGSRLLRILEGDAGLIEKSTMITYNRLRTNAFNHPRLRGVVDGCLVTKLAELCNSVQQRLGVPR